MVHYRRDRTPGGTWFFTVALHDRRRDLLTRHVGALRRAVAVVRRQRPFEIVAAVILPEHLHVIWTLPGDDAEYPARWRAIKSGFTRELKQAGEIVVHNAKGEANVWQRRYWEHRIRDEVDLVQHVNYIHYNPVKHGHVSRVCDWPYSSFHAYVRKGRLPREWAADPADMPAGEPDA